MFFSSSIQSQKLKYQSFLSGKTTYDIENLIFNKKWTKNVLSSSIQSQK